MNPKRYLVPAQETRAEIMVSNSRFIASLAPTFTVEQAREYIAQIRAEFPDATHHVPAFLIGHGASVTAHASDDGEPSGTAGRPALTVLQGSGLGDVTAVVTRYFGGTKLGTGGLVRAYGDAVKAVLGVTELAEKIPTFTTMIVLPYGLFERVQRLIEGHHGQILDEDFGGEVTLTVRFSQQLFANFQQALAEITRGGIQAEIIEQNTDTILPIGTFPQIDD